MPTDPSQSLSGSTSERAWGRSPDVDHGTSSPLPANAITGDEPISSGTLIRPAQAADLDPLADLMANSALFQRYQVSRVAARRSLDEATAAGDLVLAADSPNGDLAGVAWANTLRGFGSSAYLRLLLVHQRCQSEGVGERLLEAVEAWAAERSRHLLLLATEDNQGARRFYERHGYRKAGQLERLILPDADEILYQKQLTPRPAPIQEDA